MSDGLLWNLQASSDLNAWHAVENDLKLISRIEDEALEETILTWNMDKNLTFYRLLLTIQP
ncbi:MAG: hypothetical protein GWQ05_03735 [Verrucomicrobiaceae bacterium]|nr:hypothetical protein [Verrucomicrobiaceae bacterium]